MNGPSSSNSGIGTLKERSLHAALKEWAAQPGDQFEVFLDGYFIDLVRGNKLIEIQTGNFTQIRDKLAFLLANYPIQVIYPIPQLKYITRLTTNGEVIGQRKSPKRGRVEEIFRECIRIPHLLSHPNLSLQIVFVHVEEYWVDDHQGSWRRKHWSIIDQKLVDVFNEVTIQSPNDFASLLPNNLSPVFTNRDLASTTGISSSLAGKMTYTLRKMGILDIKGKCGNAYQFSVNSKYRRIDE
jgi:hypothetical protein